MAQEAEASDYRRCFLALDGRPLIQDLLVAGAQWPWLLNTLTPPSLIRLNQQQAREPQQ